MDTSPVILCNPSQKGEEKPGKPSNRNTSGRGKKKVQFKKRKDLTLEAKMTETNARKRGEK